jgi:hypothetical protein
VGALLKARFYGLPTAQIFLSYRDSRFDVM